MRIVLSKVYDDFCYGLRSLGAYLEKQGHEVHYVLLKSYLIRNVGFPALDPEAKRIVDSSPGMFEIFIDGEVLLPDMKPITDYEYELYMNKLAELKPDLVGFSVTVVEMPFVAELSARVRENSPGMPIVWGGTMPTSDPVSCLPHCDFLFRGESETAFALWLEDMANRKAENLSYLTESGDMVHNPLAPLLQDLDELPFPHYGVNEWLIEFNQMRQITPERDRDHLRDRFIMMSSRGCPYNCSYCCHESFRKNYRGQTYVRRRSIRPIVDEIRLRQRQLQLDSCVIWDEILLKDEEWAIEFGDVYAREVGMDWGGYGHPRFTTERMLRELQDTNLVMVALGVETGSKRISTKVYRRAFMNRDIMALASVCERLGLALTYDMISNNPYEEEQDLRDSLRLLCDLPPAYNVLVKRLKFFPGSSVCELPASERVNLPEKTHLFYNLLYHMTKDPSIPREQIMAMADDEHLKAHPEILAAIVKSTVGRYEEEQRRREAERRAAQRWARLPAHRKAAIRMANATRELIPQRVRNGIRAVLPGPVRRLARRGLAAAGISEQTANICRG
ncbi:cobalamin-dependent protein [Candidatus Sumerlaeota bacterium]|nr:cobalamin-dependent protein [Candidatus Sumerlaeota bacterium]